MDTLMITFPPPSKICLNKNLESFLSAMFPKLWIAIEIDLKTKSAKIFKQLE